MSKLDFVLLIKKLKNNQHYEFGRFVEHEAGGNHRRIL